MSPAAPLAVGPRPHFVLLVGPLSNRILVWAGLALPHPPPRPPLALARGPLLWEAPGEPAVALATRVPWKTILPCFPLVGFGAGGWERDNENNDVTVALRCTRKIVEE